MRKFLAVLLCLTLVLPTAVFAHSGRTDANGGHRDEENGDYHYHHGYEAHYHPGGVCPYEISRLSAVLIFAESLRTMLKDISKTIISAVHEWKTTYQI